MIIDKCAPALTTHIHTLDTLDDSFEEVHLKSDHNVRALELNAFQSLLEPHFHPAHTRRERKHPHAQHITHRENERQTIGIGFAFRIAATDFLSFL